MNNEELIKSISKEIDIVKKRLEEEIKESSDGHLVSWLNGKLVGLSTSLGLVQVLKGNERIKCVVKSTDESIFKTLRYFGLKPKVRPASGCVCAALELYTCVDDGTFETSFYKPEGYFDCGDNEELFLALASFQEDTDKDQWFISPRGVWSQCGLDVEPTKNEPNPMLRCRKATLLEVVSHFIQKYHGA